MQPQGSAPSEGTVPDLTDPSRRQRAEVEVDPSTIPLPAERREREEAQNGPDAIPKRRRREVVTQLTESLSKFFNLSDDDWPAVMAVAGLGGDVTEEHYELTYDEDDGDLLPSGLVRSGIQLELDEMERLQVGSPVLRS